MNLIIKKHVLGDYTVSLIVTDMTGPFGERYWMEIVRKMKNGDGFIDRASGDYKNARMLSEALRDVIGYGPARDLLLAYGVKDGEPIMYLGRNN